MSYYADSSFLVSCYLLDANTTRAKRWLLQTATPLPLTHLHLLEVPNAFRLAVFRRLITAPQAAAVMADFRNDMRSGRLVQTPVAWDLAFRVAARLSDRHSAVNGSRSLDILHVAVARTLRATDFVSFDVRQCAMATAAGLRVAP